MIVGSGLTHAVVGSALGVVVALMGTRMMTNVLYDVSAGDPRTLAVATMALMSVAAIACWLPARRAAAIDPLEAIRHE